jgi:hypothetical protein
MLSVCRRLRAPSISLQELIMATAGTDSNTKFPLDVAADLLDAQRDYVLQLVNVLAPAKSV